MSDSLPDASIESSGISAAVRELEEDIVLGSLHPRERLIEDELMRRFALKRHAAREVLAELARRGLVERRKNIGCEVRAFAVQEVVELYQLRELLEAEAARILPCPLPAEALDRLKAIQREHDQAVADEDPRAVFHTNLRFHETLFGFCNNSVLQRAIQEYARQTHAIRFSSLVDASYRERARLEHWAMIAALEEGRREDLIRVCRGHLAPSRDAYLAANRHLSRREPGSN
ncbi:GntR family transcriptional regulator [Bordetella genomosp. 4]|uniref:GntR family transcriptional regulator n=1 Tax=Bordetella genomosp. 4 TaxID=463044 RepID=UPI000B9EAEB4|nr:GntR family transcriptional regulator [Bordetella genomosp. 4]OZI47143.1 GntR family transcriptional regulator [Bordetella genomosp. 4]